MKRILGRTIRAAALVAAFSCSRADAATITFFSGDGGDVVNGGTAVVLAPHPAWGDVSELAGLAAGTAEWISFADTGIGGEVVDNADSRELGDQTAVFTRTFNFIGDSILSLWILADDTATVRLLGPNGYANTLFTAYAGQIDPCAPGGTGGGLGCVQADVGITSVSNLTAGLYTLEINVFQTNGMVFGAQYAGKVESVPEPASLLLLASGLGLAAMRKRRTGARAASGRPESA
jgi:hypothetical protein